ncbi:MAG: cytochrome b/b6 domain-containing protein, partial [Acidobacteriota bacterium]
GRWRQVLFTPSDYSRLYPMICYYFLRGPKPNHNQPYNALQKLAYSITALLYLLAIITGFVLYKPAQLSFFIWGKTGFQTMRILHFLTMVGLLLFTVGHLLMVLLNGWNNLRAMLTGWKQNPEYQTLNRKKQDPEKLF